MTRDEILNMPAGREMDALVAEKVMGWKFIIRDDGHKYWGSQDDGFAHGTQQNDDYYEDDEDFHILHWHPSESILAAWEVVEKMPYFELKRYKDNSWNCWSKKCPAGNDTHIMSNTSTGFRCGCEDAWGDTAPLAICRASLLATLEDK
jgi:hypothetical protein